MGNEQICERFRRASRSYMLLVAAAQQNSALRQSYRKSFELDENARGKAASMRLVCNNAC